MKCRLEVDERERSHQHILAEIVIARDARSISITLSSVSSFTLLTVLSKIVFSGLVRPASVESGYVVAMSALNSSHTRFLRVHETPRRVFVLRM